ncbi:MAG: septal ring lytic transglycosylase RlpA family protein [Nitrospirota bacterium]
MARCDNCEAAKNLWRLSLVLCILFLIISCSSTRYERYPRTEYGIASWYGSDFHGKYTSSGEKFNMYAMTCAHRKYPFGSVLKITNVTNNKSIDCIVNDRGPFVGGRDIDLSYAAARDIGMIGQGTGQVKIEYLGRDEAYIKEVKYLSETGPFTIQVGAFEELPNARRLERALEMRYKHVYITESLLNGRTFYRVRIGKFLTREDANNLARMLADEGYRVLITRYEEKI